MVFTHPGSSLWNPVLLTVSALASPGRKAILLSKQLACKAEFLCRGILQSELQNSIADNGPNTCDAVK